MQLWEKLSRYSGNVSTVADLLLCAGLRKNLRPNVWLLDIDLARVYPMQKRFEDKQVSG